MTNDERVVLKTMTHAMIQFRDAVKHGAKYANDAGLSALALRIWMAVEALNDVEEEAGKVLTEASELD